MARECGAGDTLPADPVPSGRSGGSGSPESSGQLPGGAPTRAGDEIPVPRPTRPRPSALPSDPHSFPIPGPSPSPDMRRELRVRRASSSPHSESPGPGDIQNGGSREGDIKTSLGKSFTTPSFTPQADCVTLGKHPPFLVLSVSQLRGSALQALTGQVRGSSCGGS